MKAADISDEEVLNFLADHQGKWTMMWKDYPLPGTCFTNGGHGGFVESIFLNHVPYKVALAKMRALMRREFIGGCDCGCRGDFEITDKGLAFIGRPRVKPYTGY